MPTETHRLPRRDDAYLPGHHLGLRGRVDSARLGGLDGRLGHLPDEPGRVRGDPGRGVGIEREARPVPEVAMASVRTMVGRGCNGAAPLSAEELNPLSAEELNPEPTALEAVARIGEAAGWQPGSGTPDGEPVRALPYAHRPDGHPLPVDRLRG